METLRDVILQAAVLADELGYEVFSISEGWGLDSTLLLAQVAQHTHQIQAIRAANPTSRLRDGIVPPEAEAVLDQFTVAGAAREVGLRLEEWDAVVDVLMIVCPAGVSWDCLEATLRAAAP
jgi:hypothetical protein